MPTSDIAVRPGLTVLAALTGAVVVGLVLGYGVGELVFASSDAGPGGGLAALGAALVAGAVPPDRGLDQAPVDAMSGTQTTKGPSPACACAV